MMIPALRGQSSVRLAMTNFLKSKRYEDRELLDLFFDLIFLRVGPKSNSKRRKNILEGDDIVVGPETLSAITDERHTKNRKSGALVGNIRLRSCGFFFISFRPASLTRHVDFKLFLCNFYVACE